jgi:hypothetical protein
MGTGSKNKKRKPLSEEQKQKKREKGFIRIQKKHRDKTLKQLALGIANKRKYFESQGLAYVTDEDGAEDIYSGTGSKRDDVSEVLSAPSYCGPSSADRLSSSSNDPVRRTMEIETENTISKVRRWLEHIVQIQKASAALDKAFQLTMARNDARTRRTKSVFLKSVPAPVLVESGPA